MILPACCITVHVRHPVPLIAAGLHAIVADESDFRVLTDGSDALRADALPVVVTDYDDAMTIMRAPGKDGAARGARVLVITDKQRELEVVTCLAAGAHGYLGPDCSAPEVLHAIRQVARGGRHLGEKAAEHVACSVTRAALTARETEVLALIASGMSNKAAARELALSLGTVKAHLKAVFQKLDARSRTEAATVARQRGLLAADAPASPGFTLRVSRGHAGATPPGSPLHAA